MMTIETNLASVLAHSVMLFAKHDWQKSYPSIEWGCPQMCGPRWEAPDMAAANREAVLAQAETFPLLRQIEAASRLGREITYTDPRTGKKVTQDFRGMSDVDVSREIARAMADMAPELTQKQLDVAKQFGTEFSEQRRRELEAADPERYKLYDQFLRDLQSGKAAVETGITAVPEYERVETPADMRDTGMTASMRADLEKQVAGELAQAGSLPPGLQRATEQALRARGAATGNILGNAAALREALGVSQAIQSSDERRRAQALGLLQSGQSTSDTANRMAQQSFQNILAATGQRNTAAQQTFAGQMAAQQQRTAGQQQNIANIQSALGLQPIVSQAAQLGGLQQGASPFAQGQYVQGMQQAGPGQLLGMGSQFAMQNAQGQFEANKLGNWLNVMKGVTESIGNLGSAAGALSGCHVARLCVPDEWEAFYFWKELLAPDWFRNLYNTHSKAVAGWLANKPTLQKLVAKWMRSKISEVTHG
jgi:hypothetical protein